MWVNGEGRRWVLLVEWTRGDVVVSAARSGGASGIVPSVTRFESVSVSELVVGIVVWVVAVRDR